MPQRVWGLGGLIVPGIPVGEPYTRVRGLFAATWMVVFVAGVAAAQSPTPNPRATPGATNPAVSQSNIATTICVKGWTGTVRPPLDVTGTLKRLQLRVGKAHAANREEDFEEDHLIPLELGGAPSDARNLWPQPRHAANGWGADRKDGLERVLNRLVCDGKLPLVQAQQAIARDWIAAYRQYVTLPAQAAAAERRQIATQQHRQPGPSPYGEYYRSVDGTLVHRPTMDAGIFGRVTAICADGSRSYSHHHQGTCSHHGGVIEWK